MGKKNKSKQKTHKPKVVLTKDPWLSDKSEHDILMSKFDQVVYYEKFTKIYLVVACRKTEIQYTFINGNTIKTPVSLTFNQRFSLDDPNLIFYLIYFDVSPEDFNSIIQAYEHFFPNASPLVEKNLVIDTNLELEESLDPTGITRKTLLSDQLNLLGCTALTYSVVKGTPTTLATLLKNKADPQQLSTSLESQKAVFLGLKKRNILDHIKFMTGAESSTTTDHIRLIEDNDAIFIDPPNLTLTIKTSDQQKTFYQCKIYYYIHEDRFSLTGYQRLEDGSIDKNPINMIRLKSNAIISIAFEEIILNDTKNIAVFLRLGSLSLQWFSQTLPLYVACQNKNIPAIQILLMYDADPFHRSSPSSKSAWEYIMASQQYDLFLPFHNQLKYYDVRQSHNLVGTALKHGCFRIAYTLMGINQTLVDSRQLVLQYPAAITAMISQKTEDKDKSWFEYIQNSTATVENQIKTIMADANFNAIAEAWLYHSSLMSTLWHKYPPSEAQLQAFINWSIEQKKNFCLEVLVVKLNKNLTLDATADDYEQLKWNYPKNIKLIAAEENIIHGKASLLDKETKPEIIDSANIQKYIESQTYQANELIQKIPDERPNSISYRIWLKLNYYKKQIQILTQRLEQNTSDVENLFEEINQNLLGLQNHVELINHILSSIVFLTPEFDQTYFHGKLTKDLTTAHTPIISLFNAIDESDIFALQVSAAITSSKDSLETSLICQPSFFIHQFFLILKNAHYEGAHLKTDLQNKCMVQIDTVLTIANYYFDDFSDQNKDIYCDKICDWIYHETKHSPQIFTWVNTLLESLLSHCHISPLEGVKTEHLINLTLIQAPKTLFITRSIEALTLLIEKRDELNLKKFQPAFMSEERFKDYIQDNMLDLKIIILAINNLVKIIPYYIYDDEFQNLLGDHYDNVKLVLSSIQLTNQNHINHAILNIEDCAIYQKPHFLLSIFTILDDLKSCFENISQHLSNSMTPNG